MWSKNRLEKSPNPFWREACWRTFCCRLLSSSAAHFGCTKWRWKTSIWQLEKQRWPLLASFFSICSMRSGNFPEYFPFSLILHFALIFQLTISGETHLGNWLFEQQSVLRGCSAVNFRSTCCDLLSPSPIHFPDGGFGFWRPCPFSLPLLLCFHHLRGEKTPTTLLQWRQTQLKSI